MSGSSICMASTPVSRSATISSCRIGTTASTNDSRVGYAFVDSSGSHRRAPRMYGAGTHTFVARSVDATRNLAASAIKPLCRTRKGSVTMIPIRSPGRVSSMNPSAMSAITLV